MTTRHWLTVRQAAEDLGYCEDTIRVWCAESRAACEQGRPESAVFPGATKPSDSPRSHWRIPEQDVLNFGAKRAVSRTTSLDDKRIRELMKARRKQAA